MEILLYGNTYKHIIGSVNWLTDTIKAALLDSGHTPKQLTHEFFDDVNADEVSGTGYSAGGATLGSKTVTFTAADSWATARADSTAYVVGNIVRPATPNGHLYMCIVAGTSGGTPPTFSTVTWEDTADGTVTWHEIGSGITQVDAGDPSWGPGATIADIDHLVIYKDTGDPATSPLIGRGDLAGPHSVTNGTFTGQFDPLGVFIHANP